MVKRVSRKLRSHWVLSSVFLAALVGGGFYAWSQVGWIVSTPYSDVSYRVPEAPQLVAAAGQTVYRIDPTRSKVTYAVDEKFIGAKSGRATGSTSGIAGDIALASSRPADSQVGQIVVDLEQLHSDNSLRDARIRSAFLQSHEHPLATFTTTDLSGLPARIDDDTTYEFEMSGTMTAKTTTAPVSWQVEAKLSGGVLTAAATTVVKMSTFDIGPISIVGLVSTEDDVTLAMDLTAVDPAKFTVPTEIAAPTSVAAKDTGDGPSFSKEIQPILEQSCAGCHTAGQVGSTHWKLETAADASKSASSIGLVTAARYMPPWPASDQGVPLAHSRSLSQRAIDLINDWAGSGGSLDVPGSTRITAAKGSTAPEPRPDVTLKMPEAYTGSLAVPNDYRCFDLDPGFTEPTYLTGYQFLPDRITQIHHAQVFQIPAAGVAASSARGGADGQPGWSCYVGPGFAGGGGRRSSLIAGWAPGQDPVLMKNTGILFQPGDHVVLQIHYHYDEQPTPDQSTLILQTEPGTTNLPELRVVNPLAPVEIPCVPGATEPLCDRAAAQAELFKQYGLAGGIQEQLLRFCKTSAEELAARGDPAAGTAASSCDSPVRRGGTIVGVMGHMHTLGSSFRMTLNPGTPGEKILLDIPNWNFDWQLNYDLVTPIRVAAGDTIRISCTWDRSRDPTRPPRYIMFAEGTEDEMCFATYGIIADPKK